MSIATLDRSIALCCIISVKVGPTDTAALCFKPASDVYGKSYVNQPACSTTLTPPDPSYDKCFLEKMRCIKDLVLGSYPTGMLSTSQTHF